MKQRDWLRPLKATLKKIPGIPQLARLIRLIANPAYRSQWLLQRNNPDGLFQPYSQTCTNRHPREFSFIQKQLTGITIPRLLSFGCSTGEEVFTLRSYFPDAEIAGIDINPRSIAVCREKLAQTRDPLIRFDVAASPAAEPSRYYDAVFCMSVLRHGQLSIDNAASCEQLIRFADFEKMVVDLCRCLKPGGYFIIKASNFRFADTVLATEFDVVLHKPGLFCTNKTPLYGPDNRRLPGTEYKEVVFYKRPPAAI